MRIFILLAILGGGTLFAKSKVVESAPTIIYHDDHQQIWEVKGSNGVDVCYVYQPIHVNAISQFGLDEATRLSCVHG